MTRWLNTWLIRFPKFLVRHYAKSMKGAGDWLLGAVALPFVVVGWLLVVGALSFAAWLIWYALSAILGALFTGGPSY